VPTAYPSDAQLAPDGSIVVVDYARPGAVIRVSPTGRLLWRYRQARGRAALDHPSLAVPLPDGTIVVNDDFRARVVVIDPTTNRIVWQYGRTDQPGRSAGRLFIPDGVCVVPPGVIPGT
jgi:outer membrane protein assembly factor BamB